MTRVIVILIFFQSLFCAELAAMLVLVMCCVEGEFGTTQTG